MNNEKEPGRPDSVREKLLSSEQIKTQRFHRLEAEIERLYDHRLSKPMRIWWRVGLGSSILFAVFGAFITIAGSIDWPLKIVWALYTVGNVFVACFASILLRRGRGQPQMYFWFGVVMVTLAVGCFASLLCRAMASSKMEAVVGAGFGEFCVVVDLILLLYGRIAGAQLSTQEHLLRLELLLLDSKTQPQ